MEPNPNNDTAPQPGEVVLHVEETPEPERLTGAQDQHVEGAVVTYTDSVDQPTAADYRAAGYGVDPELDDDAVPHFIYPDSYGEPGTVVLGDGTVVTAPEPDEPVGEVAAEDVQPETPAKSTKQKRSKGQAKTES